MRYFILAFTLLINCTCKSQSQEDRIYEGINQIFVLEQEMRLIEGGPVFKYILDNTSLNSIRLNDIDELFKKNSIQLFFSEIDRKSFEQQVESYKDFYYSQEEIIGKTVIPAAELNKIKNSGQSFWDNYEKIYGQSGFYKLSYPLFSADGTKMVVAIESCEFRSSCDGKVFIFKKEAGKWTYWKFLYGYM